MGKKKGKGKQRHTGLNKHSRDRTRLIPPLAKVNLRPVDYERNLLPEHLWLASLVDTFGPERAHQPFHDLMDAIDEVWTDHVPAYGFLTDFALVPDSARADFKETNRGLIRAAFHEPIGRLLGFYPEGPAYWLVDKSAQIEGGSLNPEVELPKLRNLVIWLLAAKDEFAGYVRVLPMARALKHGRVHFPRDFDLREAFLRYPIKCSKEEKGRVQSFARIMMNIEYEQNNRYVGREWPKYFWQHNYDLAPCQPVNLPIRGSEPLTQEEAPSVVKALGHNARRSREYLTQLAKQVRVDLYEPRKSEILLGLFARAVRLYVLMAEDSNLWARDTAGIMLRCLADTVITFCYLAKCGLEEDFSRFREYGEGQEKLLMLHLQDSYPDQISLEGRTAQAIGSELGSFAPEWIQIELGSWSKEDTRKLAIKAGLERLHRLIFSPGSSDIHGSWFSLKQSNLCYCAEALHRFHRLPTFTEPPVYLNTMIAAQDLLEECVATGIKTQGFPVFEPPLKTLRRGPSQTPAQAEQE